MLERISYISLLVLFLLSANTFAQNKSYNVSLTPFSTLINDEFSPVYYKNGIVFCTNQKNNSLITYENDQQRLYNIFFVARRDSIHWKSSSILAKELTSNYNEGPASFDETDSVIYYCRNNKINQLIKSFTDSSNTLGIFSAQMVNNTWSNIQPFTYNSSSYNMVTPAITPDGNRLYFASDMAGGYGGADLYYCDKNGDKWEKPVNLGPLINTAKNESYPFVCKSGKLFFASEGHTGLGGKDIYYSQQINGKWIKPIHLEAEINSPYDDFGLVTDEKFEKGFFSSNRRKNDDIYSFSAAPVEFPACDSMVKNTYCFLFYDEYQKYNDSVAVIYEWDFGGGIKKDGIQVKYCFPGPGKYEVKLNVIDSFFRDSVYGRSAYSFEIEDAKQGYINSPDVGIIDQVLSFDGLQTNVPDFNINDFMWDFGEGFKTRGPVINRKFEQKGDYTVQLGLSGDKDSLGNSAKVCFYKKIRIFNDYQELAMQAAKEMGEYLDMYEKENRKDKISDTTSLPKKMRSTNNMNLLPVTIYLSDNLNEVQKDKIASALSAIRGSVIAMNEYAIETSSYSILVNFVKVLNDNPEIRLEVAVHTGDKGLSVNNLKISERWASDLNSFFHTQGISNGTLNCKGYGETRPLKNQKESSNRIEFIFITRND